MADNSLAKTVEISSESPEGFQHAITSGIADANKTLNNIESVWIKDQTIDLDDGRIQSYRVTMKVTFILED
jgi:hypothetical protein